MIQRKIVSLFVIAALTACGSKSKKQADEQPVATAEVPKVQPKTDDVVPKVTPPVEPGVLPGKSNSANGIWKSECEKGENGTSNMLNLEIQDSKFSIDRFVFNDQECTTKYTKRSHVYKLKAVESEASKFAVSITTMQSFLTEFIDHKVRDLYKQDGNYPDTNFELNEETDMCFPRGRDWGTFCGSRRAIWESFTTIEVHGDTLSIADGGKAEGDFAEELGDEETKRLTVLKKVQ